MVDDLQDLPNAHFLKRHKCYWGGFGHVAASLEGIKEISHMDIYFDYVVLLTGQDYPIKSNRYISTFFRKHAGALFLEYFPLPHDAWQNRGLNRIESWHFHLFDKHLIFPPNRYFPFKRKFPEGFRSFGGSSYWCLTRECVEYVYGFTERNVAFVNFFKYVDVPDEMFFQTLILNSRFAEKAVNDNLRYIDWRDLSSGSPAILRKDDFVHIAASSKLFARKFDMKIDAGVLDMIDEQILGTHEHSRDS
jgi:hypothetical protein